MHFHSKKKNKTSGNISFLFFSGIPTHVYQYGVCVLAACPAIILAQVTALFIILPVFGKANKVKNIKEFNMQPDFFK